MLGFILSPRRQGGIKTPPDFFCFGAHLVEMECSEPKNSSGVLIFPPRLGDKKIPPNRRDPNRSLGFEFERGALDGVRFAAAEGAGAVDEGGGLAGAAGYAVAGLVALGEYKAGVR
jgi:hypothetical protein